MNSQLSLCCTKHKTTKPKMEVFFKLNVCRVCLTPGSIESLCQLAGEMVGIFQEIAGFEILNGTTAEICEKCIEKVEKCYELIKDIRGYEEFAFEPMRSEFQTISNNPDDRDPEIDVDFEACRGCLMPVTEGPMDSAIAKRGKLSKMLKLVTGVDLTKEEKIHSVLICFSCSKTLQQAAHIKFMINQNNTQYFKKIENSKLLCFKCSKMFSNAHNLQRHVNTSKCAGTSSSKGSTSTKEDVTKPNDNLKRRLNSNSQAIEPSGSIQICAAGISEAKSLICWCKKPFAGHSALKLHKLTCTSYN